VTGLAGIIAHVPRRRLSDAFTSPDRKREYNRELFTTIAHRYDLITVLLSYGQDRRWKQRLVAAAGIAPGERLLDLACGTGDIAELAAREGARVTGIDLTPAMLEVARRRLGRPGVALVAGDMMALPASTASVDAVTVGYGLRNVPSLEIALAEIARVLRPGGRLLALDFNNPPGRVLRVVYLSYLTVVGSALGLVLHGDPDTYRYIAASLRRYPRPDAIDAMMRRVGFVDTRFVPLLGGLMAIHVGRTAPAAGPHVPPLLPVTRLP
jgi:demethylmenaquinone methyltransferase/2-methoxy-6-polyprenyl-1,4-benzoquinol methylase